MDKYPQPAGKVISVKGKAQQHCGHTEAQHVLCTSQINV